MISMTDYWQQFKENIDNLPNTIENEEYTQQLATANEMIIIGLTIEQMSFMSISGVVAELQEKAKSYDHEVLYTQGKGYKFYLPRIDSRESLIFAIVYYQHLTNYQSVSYQGSISWFRQKVINAVNEKKITTDFQAHALLKEINQYCQSQNFTVSESLFLKANDESAKDYVLRIAKIPDMALLAHIDSQESHQSAELLSPDESIKPDESKSHEITRLKQLLQELEDTKNQLKNKAQSFAKTLETFNKAHRTQQVLSQEWQNTWFITKIFYKMLAWIYKPQIIKNLEKAQEEFTQAENELNQELASHETVGSYLAELEQKRRDTNLALAKTEEMISEKIASAQTVLAPIESVVIELESVELKQPISEVTTVTELKPVITPDCIEDDCEVDANSSSSNSDYYGFFKQHLPGRHVIQAVAVGAAAIVIQNLTYS